MNIYFDLEKLERKRLAINLSCRELGRIAKGLAAANKKQSNFYFSLKRFGSTRDPRAAGRLAEWYGSDDCIKFAPADFYKLTRTNRLPFKRKVLV